MSLQLRALQLQRQRAVPAPAPSPKSQPSNGVTKPILAVSLSGRRTRASKAGDAIKRERSTNSASGSGSGSGSGPTSPNGNEDIVGTSSGVVVGGGGPQAKMAPTSDEALGHSEQMLPHVGAGRFKYVGGKHWFLKVKTKLFYNCSTRKTAKTLPDDVEVVAVGNVNSEGAKGTPSAGANVNANADGGENELSVEILRLEVLRRDRERSHVAMQVNKAIDMLMDRLNNDAFGNDVFTKETALHSKQRAAITDTAEVNKIFTRGMFHYFDNDHSHEIDLEEFLTGIRILADDARNLAYVTDDEGEKLARIQATTLQTDNIEEEDLAAMFAMIAGDDGIAQMDEFVSFCLSDGTVTADQAQKMSPGAVEATKAVWELFRESEDLLMQHGALDEIAAEQNLVHKTYEGMRDQATLTCVSRSRPLQSQSGHAVDCCCVSPPVL